MKLIKPKAELLIQPWGLEGVYKQIELCGRTCYKSADKITKDSAKPFVDRLIASKHTAMLEHGTVYLNIPITSTDINEDAWGENKSVQAGNRYLNNRYSHVVVDKMQELYDGEKGIFEPQSYYVTTNLRVLVENNWLDDLKYICEPTEFHEKRYTFRMITSIGVTRELNRHRVNSIAEQSTRFCNYSKDKFGGEITYIMPQWYNEHKYDLYKRNAFDRYLKEAESVYLFYMQCGMQPQEAREVLPLCTATEICHTAFASDWKHFFDLRLFGKTGYPHPNMMQLAQLMYDEAEKHGILDDVINK